MSIKSDINLLKIPEQNRQELPDQSARDAIPSIVGRANLTREEKSGSGIDSPLTEVSRVTVEYEVFDDFNVWSTIEQHPVNIKMSDAAGRVVEFKFVDPNTGEIP